MALPILDIDRSRYDDANVHDPEFEAPPGVTEEVVRMISTRKQEPDWMLAKRLAGLKLYQETGFPTWGPDLSRLIADMDRIKFFVAPKAKETANWEDLPEDMRKTYERIGIPEAEKKSLSGVGAQYDCLTGDSLVLTNPKGAKKIKDISPNDTVFAWDEKTNTIKKAKVTAFMDKGKRPIFKVRVAGREIKVTENHPFLTLVDKRKPGRLRARYEKEWTYLSNLKQGDMIAVATDLPDCGSSYVFPQLKIKEKATGKTQTGKEYEFDITRTYKKIELPAVSNTDIMWLLGFYIGDGYIHYQQGKDKARVEFAIPENQKELRIAVQHIVKKIFKCEATPGDAFRLQISSTILARFIEHIGLKGKAKEKRVPTWIFSIPKEEKLAFLAGYLDADGGVRTGSASNPFFTSANEQLLEDMKELCAYVGIQTSRIRPFKSGMKSKSGNEIIGYRLHLSGRVSRLPSRHPIKKKRILARKFEGGRFVSVAGTTIRKHCSDSVGFARIEYIKPLGTESVYDISVEGYKNFVADGVIVHNSDIVYHSLKKEWEDKGVVFTNMDVAVKQYPELVKKYFMTSCVPVNDHKFVMLHAAVWSGGTFIYVPKNVSIKIPLQAYFRMNAEFGGQFEHTLIIADEGSEVHYIEGCSAPQYNSSSLHAGCVELHVLKGARIRYSSVENWSRNTYNLNTKRALVQEDGVVEWVNGNLGCLTGESRVMTATGPVPIEDIEQGDTVFVWDKEMNSIKESKVKAKIFSGHKEVFEMQAGGRKIRATGNHPFLTLQHEKNNPDHKKGFFREEWKPLEELSFGDPIALARKVPLKGAPYTIPQISLTETVESSNQYGSFMMKTAHLYGDIRMPHKTTKDFMWLMGLILGDGFVDLKQNKINIAVHQSESHRRCAVDLLQSMCNYTVTEKKERYIIVNSKVLCSTVDSLGFAGVAHTKSIPSWVHSLPDDQVLAFLAGYFDADGHALANGVAFTSVSEELLEDVKRLAMVRGFGVSQIMKHNVPGKTTILGNDCVAKQSWRLQLNGPRVYEIPSRNTRKAARLTAVVTRRNYRTVGGKNIKSKTNDEVGYASITNIRTIGVLPTWDIEVEGAHNFIADGLIVHNSGVTMLYPCSVLVGERARSDSLGIAFAGEGQNQDTGSKVIHAASNTKSNIVAKSISKDGGISTYRGLVKVLPRAKNCKVGVECDALLIGETSTSNTYPQMRIENNAVEIAHEATVGKIGTDEIFYLMSRGLTEEQARQMVVAGFIEPIIKELPLEYAVELNKLIELEMEGSVG